MLARYKKNDKSFMELVKLIEGSSSAKKESLMKMVQEEDAEFAAKVHAHILDYDVIKGFEDGVIAEIVASTSPKILAAILVGEEDEGFKKVIERSLGSLFAEVKSEKEVFENGVVPEAKLASCRLKLVSEARKLGEGGAIKLPVKDYVKQTASDSSSASVAGTSGTGTSFASAGDAIEADGCPSIVNFGLTKPPGGLSGERFEEFIKKNLGS